MATSRPAGPATTAGEGLFFTFRNTLVAFPEEFRYAPAAMILTNFPSCRGREIQPFQGQSQTEYRLFRRPTFFPGL